MLRYINKSCGKNHAIVFGFNLAIYDYLTFTNKLPKINKYRLNKHIMCDIVCVYKDLMMAFETVTGGRFKEIFIEQKITNINLGHSKMGQNKLKKKPTQQ